jgi:hypothetical protein
MEIFNSIISENKCASLAVTIIKLKAFTPSAFGGHFLLGRFLFQKVQENDFFPAGFPKYL